MSGGEDDKYHFVVEKIKDFTLVQLAEGHFIKELDSYKIDHKLNNNELLVRIKKVYVNDVPSSQYINTIGLITKKPTFGFDKLLLPIENLTGHKAFLIRDRFDSDIPPHTTVSFHEAMIFI